MRAELPAISFLCVAALVLVAPVFASSRNIPVLSLAAWLLCCNVIHGVNTLVWAGNDAIHVPAWCDIVTRVLLAVQLALPGSALALVLKLRRCALGQETIRKAPTLTTDLMLCFILPVVYIILHIIVQPHRFDLSTDFGCTASIHTSSLSIIFIWIPPLLLSMPTFVYAVLSVRARLDSGLFFFSHMHDAPQVNALTFIRPLVISVLIAVISFSVTIFSMAAYLADVGGLQAWTVEMWNDVHAQMSQIFVIPATSHRDLTRVEVEWWVVPACTLIFVCMTALAFFSGIQGDRIRTHSGLPHWFRRTVMRQTSKDSFGHSKGMSGQTLCSTPSSPTSMYEMKSGWEDNWRPAAPSKVKLAPLTIPDAPSRSTLVVSDPEDPFVQSTLTYIESPTGREALGLPPIPPAAYHPAQYNGSTSLPMARSPSRSPSPPKEGAQKIAVPRPASILSGPWPKPPSTIPPSPRTPSPRTPITVSPPSPIPEPVSPTVHVHSPSSRPESVSSFSGSFASSMISIGSLVLEEPYAPPFQDSASGSAGPGLAVPKHIRKARSRDVLPRSLSTSSRARRNGSDGALSGGIYMTVVRETE
ncbi:STE3-domain-containing protein [Trametes versicolor FP-101664 SS1]|uniref:STE3-domain-containing protein n=1 Tax=Trametes versicolor (strain FP-101664) TaxID=717944 RepID=UPI0004622F0F|nr:STE3-domain-containing protein [Trametes versicolor FP-101664 SS1]EIW56744.1 STE3-domain-containing protein [Trametes versicolor FP-101664 SS1]